MPQPTEEAYHELQEAFSFFNRALFENELPNCLITMQRRARMLGYFCGQRFMNPAGDRTDEIALNPQYFLSRSERGVLSTLGHEMAQLWQFHFGKRGRGGRDGRRGYHNREWANRMTDIGLYPSATGEPGGKETGYHMTHYIVEDGPFDSTCDQLLESGFHFSWIENTELFGGLIPPTAPAVNADGSHRWKYTCPRCDMNAWGKPHLALICGTCRLAMPRNMQRT